MVCIKFEQWNQKIQIFCGRSGRKHKGNMVRLESKHKVCVLILLCCWCPNVFKHTLNLNDVITGEGRTFSKEDQ